MKPSAMNPSVTKFKISLETNSEAERNKFLSLIKVINPHLTHYWEITDSNEADFVIVDIEYKKSTSQKLKTRYPKGNLVFYTQTPPPDNLLHLSKPLRAGSLISFLNHTCGSLSTKLAIIGGAESSQVFIPDYLLSQIRFGKTSVLWSVETSPVFAYCRQTDRIILNYNLFSSLLEKDESDLFNCVRCGLNVCDSELSELSKTAGFTNCSFEQFCWLAYLTLSNNVLHGDLTGNTAFGLSKWPDFTRLPHTPRDLVLAAALMKHPMTVQQLTRHTRINRKKVIGFLNACHTLGHLKVIHNSGSDSEQSPAAYAPSELVGKIMKKIMGTA